MAGTAKQSLQVLVSDQHEIISHYEKKNKTTFDGSTV